MRVLPQEHNESIINLLSDRDDVKCDDVKKFLVECLHQFTNRMVHFQRMAQAQS